ncbi:uncharacterized protein STEHIDRAFT_128168 [Stereum hirsutum FP-91666 SS1]|uniref:uncharacterized protein n=1 Tax=Stereum hirsutum (strain FP-91666) TaxID=721885 RepID=UPI000440A67D|nr:uncharacterized protein STEHIDRAFT_128168 [Stereum hirsutum FP-91666 SS1]EIM91222.1 hypothetical protein STEHIDRAFT_128168 [Stereum hirsutum FP-91666 SS1]
MGWFTSEPEKPTATSRTDRQKCWDARDTYFACLDGAKVIKAGTEGAGICAKERGAYEGSCAKSWVAYFNQRRILAERQKPMLEAANLQAEEARKKASS